MLDAQVIAWLLFGGAACFIVAHYVCIAGYFAGHLYRPPPLLAVALIGGVAAGIGVAWALLHGIEAMALRFGAATLFFVALFQFSLWRSGFHASKHFLLHGSHLKGPSA